MLSVCLSVWLECFYPFVASFSFRRQIMYKWYFVMQRVGIVGGVWKQNAWWGSHSISDLSEFSQSALKAMNGNIIANFACLFLTKNDAVEEPGDNEGSGDILMSSPRFWLMRNECFSCVTWRAFWMNSKLFLFRVCVCVRVCGGWGYYTR